MSKELETSVDEAAPSKPTTHVAPSKPFALHDSCVVLFVFEIPTEDVHSCRTIEYLVQENKYLT